MQRLCARGAGVLSVLAACAAVVAAPPGAGRGAAAQEDRAGRRERAARARALGDAYRAAGDLASALGYYHDAVQIDPEDATAYVAMVELFEARDEPERALEVAAYGVSRRPRDVGLLAALARVHLRAGRDAEALGVLRRLRAAGAAGPTLEAQTLEVASRLGVWSEALAAARALVDGARAGEPVEPALAARARAEVAPLEVLAGEAASPCAGRSPVERALGGCPLPSDGASAAPRPSSRRRTARRSPTRPPR